MLMLKDASYQIGSSKIIENFNLNVKTGEIITLFGPSGCGKSSVLRIISRLEDLSDGQLIHNYPIKITYLFQENRLLHNKTALDNLLLINNNKDLIYTIANNIHLSERDLNKYPHELSGGMKARVAFIRALIRPCNLLLMDEPFSGLDFSIREKLMELLLYYFKINNITIIMVTHDRIEALKLSSRILFFESKGMTLQKEIILNKEHNKRDAIFLDRNLKEHFEGIIYYE